MFKPPAFLESVSSGPYVPNNDPIALGRISSTNSDRDGGNDSDNGRRMGINIPNRVNVNGLESFDTGGEVSERFRVLLTPRTSAAQARALAMEAAKEIKKNSTRKTRGYWNFAKKTVLKHTPYDKRVDSEQSTSSVGSREVSQGFIELAARIQSGETDENVDFNSQNGSNNNSSNNIRTPKRGLSRIKSLGMGKVNNQDSKGTRNGKMKTIVLNEHGETELIRTVKQSEIGYCMLNPDGTIRMTWDVMIIVPFLIFLASMTPFFLCFGYDPARTNNPNLLLFEV